MCESFTAYFTAKKRRPTIIDVLGGVTQCKKETLYGYIDYFTKVAIDIMRA